jgi:putative transposase
VCLRLGFLVISRLFGWLRVSRGEESWRSAEILLLRDQLRVLQRQIDCRPKLTWADRVLIVLPLDIIPQQSASGPASVRQSADRIALAT